MGLFFHEMQHARDWHQKLESHERYQEGEMTRAEAVEDILSSVESSVEEYVDFHSALEERAFGVQAVPELEYEHYRQLNRRLGEEAPDVVEVFWEIERGLVLPARRQQDHPYQRGVRYWKEDARVRYQQQFREEFWDVGSEVSDTAHDITRNLGVE